MTPYRTPGRWIVFVCLLSLAVIFYFRLTPFDFAWEGRAALDRFSWGPLSLRDVPLNVLLFVPLGFGLGGLLARRTTPDRRPLPERSHEGSAAEDEDGPSRTGWQRARGGGIPSRPTNGGRPSAVGGHVLVICLALSAALEAAQLLLPDHAPSVADVIANGVGALVGYGLFRAWSMGFGVAVQRYATARNLVIGLGLYVLGVALLTGYLYRSVGLSNWDTSFPLVVGNEAVGRREWRGQVGYVTFTAYEAGAPLFSAAYAFGGLAPFVDATGGDAPSLDWAAGPTTAQIGEGVSLGPGEWLATAGPFAGFNELARRTGHFSIETAVTSADPAQRGPARILSISADAERRNVTVGQELDALIIRLRTPASGANGQKPELLVPGVFADERQRDIQVSYDAPMVRVSVDGTEYTLSLAPGAAFFPGFMTENRWQIVMDGNPRRYDWAYWGLVFGLGMLVFGGLAVVRKSNTDETDKDE